MNQGTLDLKSIPKFEFQINNEELTNCIKELHFTSKTHDKQLQKFKKEIQCRPTETQLADTFTLVDACIDIDPNLLKNVVVNEGKNVETALDVASNKLGTKMGQMAEVLRILFQRMQNLQKNMQSTSSSTKTMVNQKLANVQGQLDQFKKTQQKENRSTSQTIELNLNKYEQKLREVESKTLWQINDCNTKLNDRVNEQYVRDYVKESEAKIITKLKESLVKNNIDPERVDKLETRCLRLEKDIEIRIVQVNSRFNQLKQNIQHTVASKKDLANDKLDTERRISNIQVSIAQLARKASNNQLEINGIKDDVRAQTDKLEQKSQELDKIGKMVANLKISDDFQKLMQNLDPHKICEIDNTLNTLNERDLKIQKELDFVKRYQQKLKEKVEICNMLNPTDQKAKIDKDQISRLFSQFVTGNATFKKVQTFEGQLYEFKAYGDMINDINKKIGKIQKEFDLQTVIYNIKGLQQYMKKELLVMNTKLGMFESQLEEQKRKRPLSARKTSDGKLTSSISYKKLTPVDCISCFQNPLSERGTERKLFQSKY